MAAGSVGCCGELGGVLWWLVGWCGGGELLDVL